MPLFKSEHKVLKPIKEVKFDLERNIQNLVENNLDQAFNLKLVSSEFQLQGLRIDTLAFDEENKSFVIIEYKRDKSQSVIDQGFSYLALMVNNKAEFILQYNESMQNNLKRQDVDWEQSKVLFISNNFTTYQRKAIEFKDLPIELWEVKKFEHDLILFNQLQSSETSESIRTVTKNKIIENVSREVKKYTVDDHFGDDWGKSWDIYQKLRDRVLEVDDRIIESPRKAYIAFKIGELSLCGVTIYQSKVTLWLGRTEPKDLKDPDKKVIYRKKSFEHYNQHISDFNLMNVSDVDYAVFLIRQVYEKYFNKK
jgi:predicted transport protein